MDFIVIFIIVIVSITLSVLLIEEMRRRKLSQKFEERSALLLLLAHQIRTPLSGIRVYTHLLQSEDLGPLSIGQVEVLSKLERSTAQATAILRKHFSVTGPGSGEFQAHAMKMDLIACVNGAIHSLGAEISARKHHVNFDVKEKEIEVTHDPMLLHAALEGVLSNAVHYTEANGTIKVDIKKKKNLAEVTISDTGIGLTDDEVKRVGEKFYRGALARKMRPEGDGLGIYFSKSFLTLMGGDMKIGRGARGRGAQVLLSIPLTSSL